MMYQSGYLLKQAWASLKGKPGFVSAVVTTMSLSLGALLCVFTLAYLLLVSPLPYPESDALFTVEHNLVDNNADVDGRAFTYPNFFVSLGKSFFFVRLFFTALLLFPFHKVLFSLLFCLFAFFSCA